MLLDDALRDRQTEPRSSFAESKKRFERSPQGFERKSGSGVEEFTRDPRFVRIVVLPHLN